MAVSKVRFLAAAICVTSALNAAASDWRPSYPPSYSYDRYSGYPFYSSRPAQIISLDMDPKHLLNASFRIAARENRRSDMVHFIQEGADLDSVSDQGKTALMYASENCLPAIVRELLKHGANPNLIDHDGDTALIYATAESCLPAVKLILSEPHVRLGIHDRQERTVFDYAKDCAELDVDGPAVEINRLILFYSAHHRN